MSAQAETLADTRVEGFLTIREAACLLRLSYGKWTPKAGQ